MGVFGWPVRISMFIRAKKNKSGSVSIQLVSKEKGVYKVVKTIGSATERPEIETLKYKAQEAMDELKSQPSLLPSDESQ